MILREAIIVAVYLLGPLGNSTTDHYPLHCIKRLTSILMSCALLEITIQMTASESPYRMARIRILLYCSSVRIMTRLFRTSYSSEKYHIGVQQYCCKLTRGDTNND